MLFIVCFVAPLIVLVAMSAYAEPAMRTLSFAQYTKFFGDAFNLGILWSTMVLGVKATLVCLLFGYPIAWICARAPPRWQSVLVFLVVLPILTSVVVRTFSWIVILGREGILNHLLRDLHLIDEPIQAAFHRNRRRHGAGAGADAADGAAAARDALADRPEPR